MLLLSHRKFVLHVCPFSSRVNVNQIFHNLIFVFIFFAIHLCQLLQERHLHRDRGKRWMAKYISFCLFLYVSANKHAFPVHHLKKKSQRGVCKNSTPNMQLTFDSKTPGLYADENIYQNDQVPDEACCPVQLASRSPYT